MWNLSPDYLLQIKEELKGRQAAIEARMAEELRGIASDLEDIEKLESVAYSVAVKHLPQLKPADDHAGEFASLAPAAVELPGEQPTVEPEGEAETVSSRWRVRA